MTSSRTKKPRFDDKHIRLRTGESQLQNKTYVFRWTDRFGKRHAAYASTLDALREKEEQIIVDRHDGIRPDKKSATVNDMFELWKDIKRGIKDNTRQGYIYMYDTYVRHSFGNNRLINVRKSDVRMFYNRLFEDRHLRTGTVDSIHNVLYQVFQVAVDDGMIRSNPADNVLREFKRAMGQDGEKRFALTMAQQKLFTDYMLNNARYTHWYPIFFTMLNTGMRVGEITGLRWCDIDFDRNVISVNHTLVYYAHGEGRKCGYSVNTPKTKAGIREIPMTSGVVRALQMEKEYQEAGDITCQTSVEGYRDFVFLNKNGSVHNQSTLNKAIRRIMRDCNYDVAERYGIDSGAVMLPDFSCHYLRHTFATRLIESGVVGIGTIKDIMGHANIETTLDIYHTITSDVKERELTAYEIHLDEAFSGRDASAGSLLPEALN